MYSFLINNVNSSALSCLLWWSRCVIELSCADDACIPVQHLLVRIERDSTFRVPQQEEQSFLEDELGDVSSLEDLEVRHTGTLLSRVKVSQGEGHLTKFLSCKENHPLPQDVTHATKLWFERPSGDASLASSGSKQNLSSKRGLQASARSRLERLAAAIPGEAVICSLSASRLAWWRAHGPLDCLLITRCCKGEAPIVAAVPYRDAESLPEVKFPLEREIQKDAKQCLWAWNSTDLTELYARAYWRRRRPQPHVAAPVESEMRGKTAWSAAQAGLESFCAVLDEILENSSATMKGSCPKESPEERRAWWHQRIGLDVRVAALLSRMDAKLLGFWR